MPGVYLPSSGCSSTGDLPSIAAWAAQVVSQSGNAAYTTALINNRGCIVDWLAHEQRLISGAHGLHAANPDLYQFLAEATTHDGQSTEAVLRRGLRQYARTAVRRYLGTPDPVLPAMLYILMTDLGQHLDNSQHLGQPGSSASTQGTHPPTDHPHQLPQLPVQLHVFVSPVPALSGVTASGQASVLLAGRPRELADVKHVAWMVQRKALEQLKAAQGVTEVVLLNASGDAVLEGLITNFAVITTRQQGASTPTPGALRPAQGSPGSVAADSHVTLLEPHVTLPEPHVTLQFATEGVLPGTMLRKAIHAARQLGWSVVQEAPLLAEKDTWQGALLCNSLRGVVPVGVIHCHTGCAVVPQSNEGVSGQDAADTSHACTEACWSLSLPVEGHILVQRLAQAVSELLAVDAWGVDDDDRWSAGDPAYQREFE